MGFAKPDEEKEFYCNQCSSFLDSIDLIDEGKCPECYTDEYIYYNELNTEKD